MSKIRELINDNKSVLVFDVDGVLATLEWGEYNHYGEDDETWSNMYREGVSFYTEKYVIKRMQDFLSKKNKENIFVITKVFSEFELSDKKQFLKKYYDILPEHVYSVATNEEKVDVLNEIKKLYPELEDKYLVMIDDTPDILTDVMNRTRFSTAHISSFID
jgi:hypothetical protein